MNGRANSRAAVLRLSGSPVEQCSDLYRLEQLAETMRTDDTSIR